MVSFPKEIQRSWSQFFTIFMYLPIIIIIIGHKVYTCTWSRKFVLHYLGSFQAKWYCWNLSFLELNILSMGCQTKTCWTVLLQPWRAEHKTFFNPQKSMGELHFEVLFWFVITDVNARWFAGDSPLVQL